MKYKGRPNNMQTLTKKIFTCYKIIISFSICIDSIDYNHVHKRNYCFAVEYWLEDYIRGKPRI